MDNNVILALLALFTLIAFIVFAVIAPIWSLKTCVTQGDRELYNKIIWLIFMVMLWPLGQIAFAWRVRHKALLITFFISGLAWIFAFAYIIHVYGEQIVEQLK